MEKGWLLLKWVHRTRCQKVGRAQENAPKGKKGTGTKCEKKEKKRSES